jgi:hypothetical protein
VSSSERLIGSPHCLMLSLDDNSMDSSMRALSQAISLVTAASDRSLPAKLRLSGDLFQPNSAITLGHWTFT